MKTYKLQEIYRELLNEVFPYAIIQYVDNYDDYNYGCDICADIGVTLRLKIKMDNEYHINLFKYVSVISNDEIYSTTKKEIYNGPIPSDENKEPDFHFLRQVLLNWRYL